MLKYVKDEKNVQNVKNANKVENGRNAKKKKISEMEEIARSAKKSQCYFKTIITRFNVVTLSENIEDVKLICDGQNEVSLSISQLILEVSIGK